MREYLELAWTFFRMGCVTFGGGYAMAPVLERMVVRGKGWVTMEEVMDYYTIGQVTPGIIAVNVSTFVGYKRKGVAGGILSTLSFILPSLILVTVIALFLKNFAHIPAVRHAFAGIRVAVGALILDTVVKLCKGFFKDAKAVCVFGIALGLSAIFSASPVILVAAAGAAGFLLYRRRT
ncbi:MAG: chromate transporter [Treponema sp.]|jgi:chromate transporter|nr:chromate transporter [Treponema sp.]